MLGSYDALQDVLQGDERRDSRGMDGARFSCVKGRWGWFTGIGGLLMYSKSFKKQPPTLWVMSHTTCFYCTSINDGCWSS